MSMKKSQQIAATSVLAALILLLGFTPVGMINFGVIYISFLCIPVCIGTLALGINSGMILGFLMGCVSAYKALTAPSALVAPIVEASVLLCLSLCFVPRLLVPVTAHFAAALPIQKRSVRLGVAAGIGALTNTVFYLGGILFLYVLVGLNSAAILSTVGGIALAGGLPEAAAAAIIVPSVLLALEKAKLIQLRR